ncbi:hybrid sensor histidine kinase/response regulator [Maribellus maritimus]|uniref:hybrid sensor histidine kinase/response regulator n=1 Tax=Maribellus maritimus TaxID=2870838 RepID=UPI001EEA3825|nr:ATP-binding protein [Maribellus maritimus]MCG6188772.1 response regulator [Maribellus maritimus]
MSKFKIEIQITLLSLIIGAAVVTSGYYAYKSLSNIVQSIHQETIPDYQLFLVKDLTADLASLENNARLYILTNKNEDLAPYQTLQKQIVSKIEDLNLLTAENEIGVPVIDSLTFLAFQKIELWQKILNLHQSMQNVDTTSFIEIYSKLEEEKLDTIRTETEKKGIFRKIFGGKKTIVDTTIVKRELEPEEIREQIQSLETEINEIREKGEEKNILESKLIEENMVIVHQINELVALAEKNESDKLIAKTDEADRLAELTYKRLAGFTILAVILLLVVLFVLFNYLKKMRDYQRALKKAKLEAENLAVAKEKFAANVSHELRTPVNAIYGLTEQLHQKSFDHTTKELVSVLSKSAIHLKNVINDTLDFSKIQANKLKLEKTDFSPEEVFKEVIALQKFEAEKKNNELKFVWSGERPEAIVGDPLRLKQILINLLGNAIKFTQNGKISLVVETQKTETSFFRFNIRVIDTGIGISEENLNIIFDEYVQAENTEGIKYQGTGLGLSIVKKLVELHDGTISIESTPGKGTTIMLEIPYKEGKKQNIPGTDFKTVEVPEAYKNLTFLIADDTEFNRFLLKGILKKWGTKFEEVTNGNKVVEAALLNNFDLIFMDLRMPGKNGFEATKEILHKKPEAKIIAISASNEETEKQKCLDAGMRGFLSKPFSENTLFSTLSSIIKIEETAKNPKPVSPVDISELKRLAGDDDTFLKELIELFIKSSTNGLAAIEKALKYYDWNTIRETTHKMAVPYKHLDKISLYEKVKEIEKLAEKKLNINTIRSLFTEVKDETEEIIIFLKKYLNEAPE